MARLVLVPARLFGLALLAVLLAGAPVWAQSAATPASVAVNAVADYDAILAAEEYLRPPAVIERAVLAPRHLQVSLGNLSPSGEQFLNMVSAGQPKLADLGKAHYNLAGWFVDPGANRSRNLTIRGDAGIELISWADGRTVTVQVPSGATVSNARFSPDGRQVAYFVHTERDTHIHLADVSNGRSRQLTRTPVLATNVTSFEWTADGEHIVTVLLPANRGPEPTNGLPTTPKVRVGQDAENRLRTYAAVLETPHDMALVEYYATGQLARIAVRNGNVQNIGQPAMIRSLNASPDGEHFRVNVLEKPFSYLVPVGNFPTRESVWDASGEALVELASQPLREGVSGGGGGGGGQGGQDAGRRSLSWRPDGPGFQYLQRDPAPQQGGGGRGQGGQGGGGQPAAGQQAQGQQQGQQQGPRLDRLFHWTAPFTDESREEVYATPNQINTVRYSDDGQILFLTETENNRQHTFALVLSDPDTRHTITRSAAGGGGGRGGGAGGGAPAQAAEQSGPTGSLMMTRGSSGLQVVRMSSDGQHVFLSGTTRGDSEEADDPDDPDAAEETREPARPFIDKLNFRTGELTRLFEGDPNFTESVSAVLDEDVTQIVLSRQTATMVPQSIYRNLVTGEERQLTRNADFTPDELKGVQRLTFEARRADGVDIRVRVTLPPDFQEGDKLPAMFWFYPREYSSVEAYRRTVTGGGGAGDSGPGRYPTFSPSSVQLFTLLGYAVVEPDAPIIGPEGRMNDNYQHDLRNNLAAVIDELDRRGIADRDKLAIGGHSYGGFGTMNAMVQTPFFKAGISGAGNSNRMLTPLGFQSERRDLWAAREVYLSMSPLLYANNLSGALLMYHGMQDQNVGTNPINSERMFHALNGLGKTVALYMYPFEDHGQIAEETRLDMWARWVAWLDKYVKNDGQPADAVVAEDSDGADGSDGSLERRR